MIGLLFTTPTEQNDSEYMNWLYQQYHRLMFYTAQKYTPLQVEQEDIVQEALLKLIEHIKTIRDLEHRSLTAYIVLTVRNTAINHLKFHARKNVHEEELSDDSEMNSRHLHESMLYYIQRKEQLLTLWSRLPENDALLLTGKYFAGYSDRELADIFRCKPSSIRMKLTRARQKALDLLTEQGYDRHE